MGNMINGGYKALYWDVMMDVILYMGCYIPIYIIII
jgi:hypothetical protein